MHRSTRYGLGSELRDSSLAGPLAVLGDDHPLAGHARLARVGLAASTYACTIEVRPGNGSNVLVTQDLLPGGATTRCARSSNRFRFTLLGCSRACTRWASHRAD